MIAVLCSSKKPRLTVLVSSVGRREVAAGASFVGIVRSSPAGVSLFCTKGAIEGLAVRAIWRAPPNALHGSLKVGADHDDTLRLEHLEYHERVMWDGHEFSQSRPPNDNIVSTIE
jgi:hypothetical protein